MLDVCNAIAAGAPLCSLTPNSPVGTTSPSPAAGPAPAAGTYRGTTSQGLPVSVTVAAGGALTGLAFELSLPCQRGTLTFAPTLVGSSAPFALTPGPALELLPHLLGPAWAQLQRSGQFRGSRRRVGHRDRDRHAAGGTSSCTSGPISWSAHS